MEATLRVGLPGWLTVSSQRSWSLVLDVSPLIDEWALALLDPVEALRRVAPRALQQPGWELSGRATVTPAVMKLIRDAGADRDVQAVVEKGIGPGNLSLQGACLLLGLAAVTALDANIGKESARVLADVKKRQDAAARAEAQRERQRSAPAEATAAAGRPTLSPMPDDAWGTDVR